MPMNSACNESEVRYGVGYSSLLMLVGCALVVRYLTLPYLGRKVCARKKAFHDPLKAA